MKERLKSDNIMLDDQCFACFFLCIDTNYQNLINKTKYDDGSSICLYILSNPSTTTHMFVVVTFRSI